MIMQKVLSELSKIGFNLEMLYRAADQESKGTLKTESLQIFLQNLKIQLSKSQLSRFIYLIDEECNGYVPYLDYLITISVYRVAREVDEEQFSS